MIRGRVLPGFVMVCAGIGLIYLLFRSLGATAANFAEALSATPWQLYAILVVIIVLNNLIGALKWRVAIRWLEPAAAPPSIVTCFELTLLGVLFGQIMPYQISTAAVRWAAASRMNAPAGWSVRSTLYEQVFDLFTLFAASATGLVVIASALSPFSACLVLLGALALTFLMMHAAFDLGAAICAGIEKLSWLGRHAKPFAAVAQILRRASSAPPRTAIVLIGYSAIRMALNVLRAIAVASVFAPTAAPLLVAAGFPTANLAIAIPITPSGLGVAEWTWTGLLILAGALPAAAAVTTVALRVLNLIALGVVVIAMIPVHVLHAQSAN